MPFNAYTVPAGAVQNSRIDMDENDTLSVASTGRLSVAGSNQSVRFNAPTAGAVVTNDGTIENIAANGRAIRFETSIAGTLTATIDNGATDPTATIRSANDAVQIDGQAFTTGLLTINNAGLIRSTTGQGLDFGGATGALGIAITNKAGGQIIGDVSEAIRIGTTGATIVNAGTIAGGDNAGFSTSVDGIQFEDNASGTVTNEAGGVISGDRHGVDAGVGSSVAVFNAAGASITGRNGSGVGSDGSGSVTNYGTITGSVTISLATDANSPGLPGTPDGVPDGDGDGVDMDGTLALLNFGRIEGLGASGVGGDGLPNTSDGVAAGGGTIDNRAGGVIISTDRGILIDNGSQGNSFAKTTIANAGLIEGTNGIGIRLVSTFDDTIENSGTITGGNGTAILFGAGNNTLKLASTSVINGLANGEGGTDTLDYSAWGPAGVSVDLTAGTASGTGGIAGFEIVRGSAGADRLTGSAGADTLSGGAGNDVLAGRAGLNVLDGGSGTDTAQFDFRLLDATIGTDASGRLTISGGGSTNVLTGIERFQFADGVVEQDAATPLLDEIFYYFNNKDVFAAGVNAARHYETFGWKEGRDPNALFSTTGYLAANSDVRAAATNPLAHYDAIGWKEGRDPSVGFDTGLYLARNADVRAAGIDPLAHYLQYGQAEGRAIDVSVGRPGSFTRGSFDAEYYLLANLDVARAANAAGADSSAFAYAHYSQFGFKEGRDPNAYFNTKGYLAAYGDVRAAGIDPLLHYDRFGWKEGRDPSGSFDTDAYRAANPDVAAAGVDPLLHFLQFGRAEGRSSFPDGIID